MEILPGPEPNAKIKDFIYRKVLKFSHATFQLSIQIRLFRFNRSVHNALRVVTHFFSTNLRWFSRKMKIDQVF